MTNTVIAQERSDTGSEVQEPALTAAEVATLDEWIRDWQHYKKDSPPDRKLPLDLVREVMIWLMLTGHVTINEGVI